jgi:superfamily II DNA helicase RecQ
VCSSTDMSRAYRISVKESLSRHVEVEDGVCSSLELLPILAKERMAELLAAELEQRGFKREGAVATRKEGDVVVEVNLETGLVSVTAEGHAQVNLETERTAVVDNTLAGDRERHLRDAAKQSLEREAKAEEEALRRKVTEQLEGKLRDLKEELDGAVNRVTGTALKQRAAELGQVEEVHEEANGSITIKVRV